MANTNKPNILVIFGDDIGMWNVGAEKYYPSVPYIFNLRMDPMERANRSGN